MLLVDEGWKKLNKWVMFWERSWFPKGGDLYQCEEEHDSTFSNGSTSSAQVSSSNMKSNLARLPLTLPDPFKWSLAIRLFITSSESKENLRLVLMQKKAVKFRWFWPRICLPPRMQKRSSFQSWQTTSNIRFTWCIKILVWFNFLCVLVDSFQIYKLQPTVSLEPCMVTR